MGGSSPSQQQSDAAAEVKKITQVDHTDGASHALDTLMADYKAYQAKNNPADSNGYWDAITKQLNSTDGKQLLPDLSVAWGKENLQSADLAGTGALNAADLTQFNRYDLSNPQNNYDHTFADGLLANNNQLLTDLSQHNDYGYYPTTSADAGAFDYYLNNQTKNNSNESDQAKNLTAMAPLFADNGALLKSLDTAKNPGSSADGNVSGGDMSAWIATAQRLKDAGQLPETGGVFNQKNLDYVTALSSGKLGVDDKGAITTDGSGKPVLQDDGNGTKFLWWGHNGFDVEKLAKQGGFTANDGDLAGAVTSFNNQVTSDNAFTGSGTDATTPKPASANDAPGSKGSTPTDTFSSLPADQQTAITNKVTSDFVALSAAQPGDGYIKVAARLLGKPSDNDTNPDVAELYKELEAANNNKELHPGTQVLTPEILSGLNNHALTAQMVADRSKLVQENFGAAGATST